MSGWQTFLERGSALLQWFENEKQGNDDIPVPANMIGVAQGRIDRRLVHAERPSDDEIL